jgi:hypothetical protein
MSHSSSPPTTGSRPEQRRWARVPIDVRVRLRYEREGTQQQCHCRGYDISESMGLMSPYELEFGQLVDLEFLLPESGAPIKIRAVVRSQVGFRLGCEFIALTEDQKADIRRYGTAFQPSQPLVLGCRK